MQFSQQEDDVSGDSSLGTDDEPNDELTKVRAQAKSNRKVYYICLGDSFTCANIVAHTD